MYPLKFRDETPNFANLRTQNRHFEPQRSLMRGKSENIKQQGQSVARLRRRYNTWPEKGNARLKYNSLALLLKRYAGDSRRIRVTSDYTRRNVTDRYTVATDDDEQPINKSPSIDW